MFSGSLFGPDRVIKIYLQRANNPIVAKLTVFSPHCPPATRLQGSGCFRRRYQEGLPETSVSHLCLASLAGQLKLQVMLQYITSGESARLKGTLGV